MSTTASLVSLIEVVNRPVPPGLLVTATMGSFETPEKSPQDNLSAPGKPAPQDWSYRHRISLTVLSVVLGLLGTVVTAPMIAAESEWTFAGHLLAWSLLAAAIVLRLWAASHISGRKSRSVVDSGPYAICRNPLYVGTLLIAVSQMVFLQSWPFILACLLPIALYATHVVQAEEELLRQRLGTEYDEFCSRVPRWSLSWRGLNFTWRRPENWNGFRAECWRCLWWLTLPFACQLVIAIREWVARTATGN